MPTWGWILIAAAVVLVIAAIVMSMRRKSRSKQLQSQFGPEYDRTIESADSKRKAESDLAARQERREQLDIRPLSSAARERYTTQWQTVQAQFVDNPTGAVASADTLIQSVMGDRGYPVDDFETRAADVSVDHPHVVENYREGHRLAEQSANGNGSTEELRQAMRHYRALFDELVEPEGDADAPTMRGRTDTTTPSTQTQRAPR
ncbi:MAG: hypothetical protein ACJ74N_14815 [Gaiellaceae bacterium]